LYSREEGKRILEDRQHVHNEQGAIVRS